MRLNSLNNSAVQLLQAGDVRDALNLLQKAFPGQNSGPFSSAENHEPERFELDHREEGWMTLFCEPVQAPLNMDDDRIVQACILFNLAIVSIHLQRNEEAIKFFNLALSQIPPRSSSPSPESCAHYCEPSRETIQGHIEFRLGCICFSEDRFEDALEKFEEAYKIRRDQNDHGDGHHLDVVAAIYAAALCNEKIGNDITALYLLMDFIDIVTLRHGEGHSHVAIAFMIIGDIHYNRTDLQPALENYLKGFQSLQKSFSAEKSEMIIVLTKIGEACIKLSDYKSAVNYFNEKLTIERSFFPESSLDVIGTLIQIAQLYQLMEDFDQAFIFYQEVLHLQYSMRVDNLKIANTLSNIGRIRCSTGNYEEAIVLYEEALSLRESILGQLHYDVSTNLNLLGAVHFRAGRNDLALANYQECLRIHRSLNSHPREISAILTNIAAIHEKNGDDEAALVFQMQALEIERSNASNDCVQDLGSMISTSVADANLHCARAA